MKTCAICIEDFPATLEYFSRNRNAKSGLDSYCKPCRRKKNHITNPDANRRFHGRQAYSAWASMKARCDNPNRKGYHRYGGRGITYCERWKKFENFLADMGDRPAWATGGLDRIDPDGNYEPGNCRWTTIEVQANNKSKRKS